MSTVRLNNCIRLFSATVTAVYKIFIKITECHCVWAQCTCSLRHNQKLTSYYLPAMRRSLPTHHNIYLPKIRYYLVLWAVCYSGPRCALGRAQLVNIGTVRRNIVCYHPSHRQHSNFCSLTITWIELRKSHQIMPCYLHTVNRISKKKLQNYFLHPALMTTRFLEIQFKSELMRPATGTARVSR